jgi:hypothetical protein
VDTFIGARALDVDHGAKSREEAQFIERFQRSGPRPDLPKAEFEMASDKRESSLE